MEVITEPLNAQSVIEAMTLVDNYRELAQCALQQIGFDAEDIGAQMRAMEYGDPHQFIAAAVDLNDFLNGVFAGGMLAGRSFEHIAKVLEKDMTAEPNRFIQLVYAHAAQARYLKSLE